MLVETLWREQHQEANFTEHGDLIGCGLLLSTLLQEVRPNRKPTVLCFPHGHFHLALGGLAVACLVPAGLALPDMTAVLKLTVLGKGADLAVDVLCVVL